MKSENAVNDVFWYNCDMVHLKRTVVALIVLAAIVMVGILVIIFARGYRFNFGTRSIGSKGILVANSAPNNAQIMVNGKLLGVTSDNLYLSPGNYQVVIKKEGYSDWQKNFTIKGEVVSRVDAQLFSSNPSLSPLTNNGVINPQLSPLRDKLVYLALPDDNELLLEKNDGLMLSNLNSSNLSFFRQHNQLIPYAKLPAGLVPEKTHFVFSNDEKALLAFFYDEYDNLFSVIHTTTGGSLGGFSDVTLSYQEFLAKWWAQRGLLQEKQYDTVKQKVRRVLKQNTLLVEVSPDKSKLLYFTLKDAQLPRSIQPPLIGSVPTREERALKAANFYIYDKKEDKNFLLSVASSSARLERKLLLDKLSAQKTNLTETDWFAFNHLFEEILWYSDSGHLIFSANATISIIEYDGSNRILVYSGPFEKSFLATTSDGRIVTLTNINPKKNKLPDLYSVSIK